MSPGTRDAFATFFGGASSFPSLIMTSRQRVEAALQHREPDRTPFFEYVLQSPVADRLLGRPFADFGSAMWKRLVSGGGWEAAVRQYGVDRLDLAEYLGHDLVYVPPNPPPPRGASPVSDRRPDVSADPVERVRRRNELAEASPAGPAAEQLLVYVLVHDEMGRRGMDLPLLAPAYAHGVWTDVDLMQTMVVAPEVAHRHFELATRRALAAVDAYREVGVDQFGVGGDFAGNRLLISPAAYREFIVPGVRQVVRRIHELGGYAINASDGNLWPVLDDFLLECQVDGYLEIDLGAGMDLRRLKARYGDRITFYGNMDCGATLSFSPPDEVARVTREILEAGRGNGGHIFCASNAVTASVPPENYLTMVNVYREIFGLPPKEWPSR